MSIPRQDNRGQSVGRDPKASKRSSGLFSFFKWFKPIDEAGVVVPDLLNTPSSSCDSIDSAYSTGTVASFSYVPPSAYKPYGGAAPPEKSILPGPLTDTYRERLHQREKRRECDKNLTLRKKYNLFFNRDTLLRPPKTTDEDNSRSLPLMTRKTMQVDEEEQQIKAHRRTNSESSKLRKAGAFCHVKGKRRAPQPPGGVTKSAVESGTMSLRRKKRLAPQPPAVLPATKILTTLEHANKYGTIEYADADIIFNDSLKLDNGFLKPTKAPDVAKNTPGSPAATSSRYSAIIDTPVSPRPWYKRTLSSRDSGSSWKANIPKSGFNKDDYEPIDHCPDVSYSRSSKTELNFLDEAKVEKKKDEKRKSGLSFLTNISELDREAAEIVKQAKANDEVFDEEDTDLPPFMRPRTEHMRINSDSWVSPKRRSARDLIAKFNAITNVTKVTVNSAFFSSNKETVKETQIKRDYFGKKSSSVDETVAEKERTISKYFDKKGNNEGKRDRFTPLSKSESTSVVQRKSEPPTVTVTPKLERKSWYCPKCSVANDYWRIICHVCSTIKPYFDDLTAPPVKNNSLEKKSTPQITELRFNNTPSVSNVCASNNKLKTVNDEELFERVLQRSKTQIGFPTKSNIFDDPKKRVDAGNAADADKKTVDSKKEEREKLKKMLIEMKNSLPKRRLSNDKAVNRTSIIQETSETNPPVPEMELKEDIVVEPEKVVTIMLATTETVYENVKVKRTENPKPVKVSSSVQTNAAVVKKIPNLGISGKPTKPAANENTFELIRAKDFFGITNDKTGNVTSHVYANLNDDNGNDGEPAFFLNMPKRLEQNTEKNRAVGNTDTIEINRLLRRLETAISKGELGEASVLARDLAQLKVNCSVVRQKSVEKCLPSYGFTVDMYVEDRLSHRGPFPIQVFPKQTVHQLKTQVEKEFQIPSGVQRWILGKQLASDDNATLKDHNVTSNGCPIFLYLVAPANDVKQELPIEDDLEGAAAALPIQHVQPTQPKIVIEPKQKQPEVEPPPPKRQSNVTPKPIKEILPPELPQQPPATAPQDITPLAEIEDYDNKTLKPSRKLKTDWECDTCTLLNPLSSNICAVCATIRKITPQQQATESASKLVAKPKKDQHYLQLIDLDNKEIIRSAEAFECIVCLTECAPGDGVTLRECLHQFCRACLAHTVEFCDEAEVKCPYRDEQYACDIALQDREVKALVSATVYDQHLAKSVAQAENKTKSFHCKTPDCKGWCIFEDNVNDFRCPVCRKTNCLTCQAIHMGVNCREYQERMKEHSDTDIEAKKTREMLDEMVSKGEALKCPTCQVVLMKKWGCDWLRCSMCKTEICWVTRGPRWGPAGKGDISGGCQCGVNGIKCHPQCNYCH